MLQKPVLGYTGQLSTNSALSVMGGIFREIPLFRVTFLRLPGAWQKWRSGEFRSFDGNFRSFDGNFRSLRFCEFSCIQDSPKQKMLEFWASKLPK